MTSVFEIIGPVMTGPSSSHTAGMARIGTVANKLFKKTHEKISLTFSHAMQKTYKGHKSDSAVIGGILGFGEASPKLKTAVEEAQKQGIEINISFFDESYPPNTVLIELESGKDAFSLEGVSVGGGSIVTNKINGKPTDYTPELSYGATVCEEMKITRIDEAIAICEKEGITLSELAVKYEMRRSGFSREKIERLMSEQLEVMKQSVASAIGGNNPMLYGLTGGNKTGTKIKGARKSLNLNFIPKAHRL